MNDGPTGQIKLHAVSEVHTMVWSAEFLGQSDKIFREHVIRIDSNCQDIGVTFELSTRCFEKIFVRKENKKPGKIRQQLGK